MAEIRLTHREAEDDLPNVCVVCGRQATLVQVRTFSCVGLMERLAFGLVPFGILALLFTKRVNMRFPLCHADRYHWTGPVLGIFCGFVFVAATIFLATNFDPTPGIPWLVFVAIGTTVCWIGLTVVLGAMSIRPIRITEDEITLKGVSAEFVNAVLDADRRERENRYRLPPGIVFVEDRPPMHENINHDVPNDIPIVNIQDLTRPRRPSDENIRE